MPKLGNTVEECLLAKWRKQPGEAVAAGEVIAEIETDKASFDLTAPVAGTLLAAFFNEGALVPVYTNICVIGEAGENAEVFRPSPGVPPPAPEPPAVLPAASEVAAAGAAPAPPAAPVSPPPPAKGTLSPRARRFAERHGFSPGTLSGSGPGGRVLERDIRAAYYSSPRLSSLAARYVESGYEIQAEGSGAGGLVLARDLGEPGVALSGVRARIARRMRESLASTAQYTLNASADATGLLALRGKIKAARANGAAIADVNIGDMIMFCAIRTLVEMPWLNVEFSGGKLYQRSSVHIGFACDTPRGLLVPVVRASEKLTIEELAGRIRALTQQALDGSISPDDLAGGTFTVSNLGSFGIESFTPILNPPQVAVLGVDAIQLKPVRRNGGVEFVDHLGLSLTLDHQVIDGAPGARFLQALRNHVENIESLSGLRFQETLHV